MSACGRAGVLASQPAYVGAGTAGVTNVVWQTETTDSRAPCAHVPRPPHRSRRRQLNRHLTSNAQDGRRRNVRPSWRPPSATREVSW
jgi:hypothetical protein